MVVKEVVSTVNMVVKEIVSNKGMNWGVENGDEWDGKKMVVVNMMMNKGMN